MCYNLSRVVGCTNCYGIIWKCNYHLWNIVLGKKSPKTQDLGTTFWNALNEHFINVTEQCGGGWGVIVDYFVALNSLEEWKEQKTFIKCINVITVFAEGYMLLY